MVALIAVIIIAGIVVVAYLVYDRDYFRGGPSKRSRQTGMDELSSLKKEKGEIEKAIRLMKIKFYKRQIDEDSYRAIIKDYQEKLTSIEAKIK
jgi:hypothetical protein